MVDEVRAAGAESEAAVGTAAAFFARAETLASANPPMMRLLNCSAVNGVVSTFAPAAPDRFEPAAGPKVETPPVKGLKDPFGLDVLPRYASASPLVIMPRTPVPLITDGSLMLFSAKRRETDGNIAPCDSDA